MSTAAKKLEKSSEVSAKVKTVKKKAIQSKNNSQASMEPKATYNSKVKAMPRYAQPLQSKTAKPKPTQAIKTQQTKRVKRAEV